MADDPFEVGFSLISQGFSLISQGCNKLQQELDGNTTRLNAIEKVSSQSNKDLSKMQSVQAERLRSLECQVKNLEKTYQDNQAPFDLRLTAIEESLEMRPPSDLPSSAFDDYMPPPSKIPAKKITANPVHEFGIERAPPSVHAHKLSSSEVNDLAETDKMTPSLSKSKSFTQQC